MAAVSPMMSSLTSAPPHKRSRLESVRLHLRAFVRPSVRPSTSGLRLELGRDRRDSRPARRRRWGGVGLAAGESPGRQTGSGLWRSQLRRRRRPAVRLHHGVALAHLVHILEENRADLGESVFMRVFFIPFFRATRC